MHLRGNSQSVDPLTGKAVVNIPLGEISALDLSASVSISHHGGALRVNESPGSVGMGWQLNAGGSITREVRGLPDDYNVANDNRKGWLYSNNASGVQNFNPSADDVMSTCADEVADWNFLNNVGFVNDTEPDIFYFSAPGIAGKFVFGSDGLPKLIPYQDLEITFSNGVFTIRNSTGITYTFNQPDVVQRQAFKYKNLALPVRHFKKMFKYYETELSFKSTWNLVSVSSAATGAVVNYAYQSGTVDISSQYVSSIKPNAGNTTDTLYYLQDKINASLLTSITLQNYGIGIEWENSRVFSVTISESETGETKGYQFRYRQVKGDNNEYGTPHYPFLMQLRQQNSCVAYPAYTFMYSGIDTTLVDPVTPTVIIANIPWNRGWGEDHFGYYNGQTTNKNIPTIYYYGSETGARRYRVSPIPGLTTTLTLNGTAANSRNVNSAFTEFGALKMIYFPTGGFTSFTYENNKYWDATTNEELFGPGVRVSTISTKGGAPAYGRPIQTTSELAALTKSYQYTDGGSSTSGKLLYPPSFVYVNKDSIFRTQYDLGPGSQILYSRVKETVSGQGYRIYQYDIPNMYADNAPIVTPGKVARPSGANCTPGYLQNGIYSFPFAPVQDLDYMRGFLTNVTEYDQNNVVTQERSLQYITPQATSTLKGLRFEAMEDILGSQTFFYGNYIVPINQSRILWKETVKNMADNSSTNFTSTVSTNTYNSKNMLVQVNLLNDDASEHNRFIKYSMDYNITSPAASDVQANAIFKLNSAASRRYGEVIETYQTFKPIGASSSTTTGAQLTIFKDYGSNVFPYQSKSLLQGFSFTPSTATTGATQSFTSDSRYILDATVDYLNSLPVNQTDRSLISKGTHYSTGTSLPLATFFNCKAENAVYEGFELAGQRGLGSTGTGTTALVTGWTGKNAIQFFQNPFTTNPITKNGDSYRVSMWVNSSQAATITVVAKSGSTVQSTMTLNNTTLNQWNYLEGSLNTAGVSPTFTLEVSANVTIQLDDFVALPSTARVSTTTYRPLTGVTSQTDDRGRSNIVNYDIMGRKTSTLDHKRNLVELLEYGVQKQGRISLRAGFTANTQQYMQNQPVIFTAAGQCLTQLTYTWIFTDQSGAQTTATGAQVTKTFTAFGPHKVQLTTSAQGYADETMVDNICVAATALNLNLSVSPNNMIYQCSQPNDSGVRVFTPSVQGIPQGLRTGWDFVHAWVVRDVNNNVISGTTNNGSFSFPSPGKSYTVYCSTTAIPIRAKTELEAECYSKIVLATRSIGVTFIPENNCP